MARSTGPPDFVFRRKFYTRISKCTKGKGIKICSTHVLSSYYSTFYWASNSVLGMGFSKGVWLYSFCLGVIIMTNLLKIKQSKITKQNYGQFVARTRTEYHLRSTLGFPLGSLSWLPHAELAAALSHGPYCREVLTRTMWHHDHLCVGSPNYKPHGARNNVLMISYVLFTPPCGVEMSSGNCNPQTNQTEPDIQRMDQNQRKTKPIK